MKLNNIVFILLMISLCLCSCKKEEMRNLTPAIITGQDFRFCPCCGGFIINFDGNDQLYEGDFKVVFELPEPFQSMTNFPLNVLVEYEEVEYCDVIEIKTIELQ